MAGRNNVVYDRPALETGGFDYYLNFKFSESTSLFIPMFF